MKRKYSIGFFIGTICLLVLFALAYRISYSRALEKNERAIAFYERHAFRLTGEREFEEDYVNLIRDYLLSGRTLILCGAGDASAPEASARLNVLAEALGLTARFRDDTAFDPVNNGGRVDELYTTVYNDDIDSSRPYCQTGGCTVDSGMGTWLVRGMASTFSIDGDGDGEGALEETCTEVVEGFDVVHALVTRPGEAVLLAREQSFFGGRTPFIVVKLRQASPSGTAA